MIKPPAGAKVAERVTLSSGQEDSQDK